MCQDNPCQSRLISRIYRMSLWIPSNSFFVRYAIIVHDWTFFFHWNHSKTNISQNIILRLNLYTYREVQIVTFHATTPHMDTKKEEIVVTEISKGPVEAGGTTDYEQHLDIPPLPPSNLANCGIIDLEYNLKVEACVEGWLIPFLLYI